MQEIKTVRIQSITETKPRFIPPVYTFNPTKYKRISNFLWKFLHRIQSISPYIEPLEVTTFLYTPQKRQKLTSKIIETLKLDLYRIMDEPDNYILVCGNKDFKELCCSPDFIKTTAFETGPYSLNHKIFNIPIHVVPYLEGFALIPRVIIEKNGSRESLESRMG